MEENKVIYYPNSIEYKGKRENVPQPDGNNRNLYAVTYMVSSGSNEYDSDYTYSAYFDMATEDLLYIIGPQSFEKIKY